MIDANRFFRAARRSAKEYCTLAALTILALPLLSGCQPAFQAGPIEQAPRLALATLREAHQKYTQTLSTPLARADYESAMNDVANHLIAAATQQAPRGSGFISPVPLTLSAELHLDTSRGADARALATARQNLVRAVDESQGCPEWIPGFVSLARIETRLLSSGGSVARVQGYLSRAESELKLLEDAGIGLGEIALAAPPPHDPSHLTEEQKLQLLVHWLTVYELWLDPYLAGTPSDSFGMMLGQQPSVQLAGAVEPRIPGRALLNRLRSRIEYQRAEILVAQGADAERICDALDEARRWDKDFYPIALEYAVQLRRLARFKEAESLLQPYLTQSEITPVFRNNARFWLELAQIYHEWFNTEPSAKLAESAIRAYRRLVDNDSDIALDPGNPEAWQRFADFYERFAASFSEHAAGASQAAARCRVRAGELGGA